MQIKMRLLHLQSMLVYAFTLYTAYFTISAQPQPPKIQLHHLSQGLQHSSPC